MAGVDAPDRPRRMGHKASPHAAREAWKGTCLSPLPPLLALSCIPMLTKLRRSPPPNLSSKVVRRPTTSAGAAAAASALPEMDPWAAQRTAQQCLSIKYVEDLAEARQTTQTSLGLSFVFVLFIPCSLSGRPHCHSTRRDAAGERRPGTLAHWPRQGCLLPICHAPWPAWYYILMCLCSGQLSSGTKDAYLRGAVDLKVVWHR